MKHSGCTNRLHRVRSEASPNAPTAVFTGVWRAREVIASSFCRELHTTITEFSAAHPDVGILHRNLPRQLNVASKAAAEASVCAQEQGRFRAFHDRLFTWEDWSDLPDWETDDSLAGVADIDRFEVCLKSDRTRMRLAADRAVARRVGIRATPTTLSRTSVVTGPLTIDAIEKMLR